MRRQILKSWKHDDIKQRNWNDYIIYENMISM